MFSKMTQVLILAGSLLAAGAASANERDVIVPVIAGAAVGALLATVISNSSQDHHRPRQDYRPQPRYQPQYQAVRYVPVRPAEYRRFDPPHRGYYDVGPRRDYDHGRGNGRW
jgi:hypothetical protein